MWLRHEGTGKVAPIDWDPVPGGNILIHGDTYEVLVGSERAACDPTELDPDAQPRLRVNHHMTCTSIRARATTPSESDYAPWRDRVDVKSLAAGERPDDD